MKETDSDPAIRRSVNAEREPLPPAEFEAELRDLKALNEWKHGGMLILTAPIPRLPLWRGLVSFGRRKS